MMTRLRNDVQSSDACERVVSCWIDIPGDAVKRRHAWESGWGQSAGDLMHDASRRTP
jgi:hypothetical protein